MAKKSQESESQDKQGQGDAAKQEQQEDRGKKKNGKVTHVVVRKFIAYGVKLDQGVGVSAEHWPKLLPLMNAKFLRAATPADKDRRFVDVPARAEV